MKHLLSFVLLSCLILSSCQNESEQKIEETSAPGVVLVQNQSYFEVQMPNGSSMYFSRFDEDGDISGLALDKDSVEPTLSYGTGFFVSPEGEVATNAHVVDNMVEDKAATRSVSKFFSVMKEAVKEMYYVYKGKCDTANVLVNYALYDPDVSVEEYNVMVAIRDSYKEEMNDYANMYSNIDDVNASDCDVKYHAHISIAYNNTYVTDLKDFSDCVVTKTDHDHDLAIIQLKGKKTPADNYVFTVPEADPLETYSFTDKVKSKIGKDKNDRLYMLSFNLGPTLALTKEGVKSQFNNGTISQRTGDRLMYSIPALHGSSGSPVLNHEGELVAVNYAGLSNAQNFNYGIRVKYLRELLDK